MLKISSTNLDKKRGFTLVELVVSIGIMVVILTIVLSGQSTYTSGSSLRQAADDISLSLRQAQVYGISVNQLTPGKFDVGYGVEFLNASIGGSNDAYVLFGDKGPSYNYIYDSSWACSSNDKTNGECLTKTTLAKGNTIEELCYIPLSGAESCGVVARADITFLRPATEAHISLYDASASAFSNVKGVRIKLVSIDQRRISVVVYTTGQISVN